MNTINLKNDLINQINLLSEEQLKTVMAFINNLYQQHLPIQESQTIKQEERMALTEKFIAVFTLVRYKNSSQSLAV